MLVTMPLEIRGLIQKKLQVQFAGSEESFSISSTYNIYDKVLLVLLLVHIYNYTCCATKLPFLDVNFGCDKFRLILIYRPPSSSYDCSNSSVFFIDSTVQPT